MSYLDRFARIEISGDTDDAATLRPGVFLAVRACRLGGKFPSRGSVGGGEAWRGRAGSVRAAPPAHPRRERCPSACGSVGGVFRARRWSGAFASAGGVPEPGPIGATGSGSAATDDGEASGGRESAQGSRHPARLRRERCPPACGNVGGVFRVGAFASGRGEVPEPGLGQLDGVAGRVADVDRAGAARPEEVGLDLDPGGDEAGAPAVELGGGGGEGDVAGAAGAVRGDGEGAAGGRSVAAGSKTRSIASRRRKKTCLSPARVTRSRPRTPA